MYMYVVVYTCNCNCVKHFYKLFLSSDPTLTTHNIIEVMKSVNIETLTVILHSPETKYSEIKRQYQNDEQRKEALVSHAVLNNPCLTWKRLSERLQFYDFSELATEMNRKYVKGQ